MNITENIKNLYTELSNCSVKFLEFVEKHPESLERSCYQGLNWHDKRIKLQPWPTFINQYKKREMETASIGLCKLIKSIPERFFQNKPHLISQYYGIPLDIIEFQLDATNPLHMDMLLARADFVFCSSQIKCLEFNISSDLGGLENPIYAPLYFKVPIISHFLAESGAKIMDNNLLLSLLKHLTHTALQKWPCDDEFNIAFVIPRLMEETDRKVEKIYLNQTYQDILHQVKETLNGQIIFCDYHHLESSHEGIFFKDTKIHVLTEFYGGNVAVEVLDHFRQGNILVYNGPISRILSNKFNLVLLSENQDGDMFCGDEQEIIKKYVPWTRKLKAGGTSYENFSIQLEDFTLNNKDKLVIKPAEGYGGNGVSIGKKTPAFQWRESVKQGISRENYLVQEYVESSPYLYQTGERGCEEHDVVWGGFVFGSQYTGGWARTLPKTNKKGIINTNQGAEVSVVFEVHE